MPKIVVRPLSARLVLLAAAAALALAVVWAVAVAEHRDGDGRPAKGSGVAELRAPAGAALRARAPRSTPASGGSGGSEANLPFASSGPPRGYSPPEHRGRWGAGV